MRCLGYLSTGMAAVFLRASRHCPAGLLLGISWIVSLGEAVCLFVFAPSLRVLIPWAWWIWGSWLFPHEKVSLYLTIFASFLLLWWTTLTKCSFVSTCSFRLQSFTVENSRYELQTVGRITSTLRSREQWVDAWSLACLCLGPFLCSYSVHDPSPKE